MLCGLSTPFENKKKIEQKRGDFYGYSGASGSGERVHTILCSNIRNMREMTLRACPVRKECWSLNKWTQSVHVFGQQTPEWKMYILVPTYQTNIYFYFIYSTHMKERKKKKNNVLAGHISSLIVKIVMRTCVVTILHPLFFCSSAVRTYYSIYFFCLFVLTPNLFSLKVLIFYKEKLEGKPLWTNWIH